VYRLSHLSVLGASKVRSTVFLEVSIYVCMPYARKVKRQIMGFKDRYIVWHMAYGIWHMA
jgi:hypothetical protein